MPDIDDEGWQELEESEWWEAFDRESYLRMYGQQRDDEVASVVRTEPGRVVKKPGGQFYSCNVCGVRGSAPTGTVLICWCCAGVDLDTRNVGVSIDNGYHFVPGLEVRV